jgi:hypothetical protein
LLEVAIEVSVLVLETGSGDINQEDSETCLNNFNFYKKYAIKALLGFPIDLLEIGHFL